MQTNFSQNELKIIQRLSPHWYDVLTNAGEKVRFNEPSILEIIALDCFLEGNTTKASHALKQCIRNIRNRVWRGTEQYEKDIEFWLNQ